MSETARVGVRARARARRTCCRENLFVSLAYSAVNAIAPGRLTYLRASNESGGRRRRAARAAGGWRLLGAHVLRNGMISAPLPGAVTTSTSLVSRRIV